MHDRRGARRATTRLLAGLTMLVGLIVGTLGVQEGGRPVVAQDVGDAALRLTATSMAATIEALGAVVTAAARATYIAELQQAADLVAGQTATAAAAMPQATPSPRTSPTAARTPTATTALKAPPKAPAAQARGLVALVSGLNIRSGPGTGYGVISSASSGQFFSVTGKVAGCTWLRIDLGDAREAWVTGAATYARLTIDCDDVPLVQVAAPVAVATTAPAAPAARATVAPAAPPDAAFTIEQEDALAKIRLAGVCHLCNDTQ